MNSSFGTTVARRPRPHFRHSLASGPLTDQVCTSRFGERGISTPTCWGLLKQPDNQKMPRGRQFTDKSRWPFPNPPFDIAGPLAEFEEAVALIVTVPDTPGRHWASPFWSTVAILGSR